MTVPGAEEWRDTPDLAAEVARLRSLGWRPCTIRPADDPAEAVLESPEGSRVRLRSAPVVISRVDGTGGTGRAGMGYRDLIPGRWDGRWIASHITVPDGGPVPDDVHFHHLDVQFLVVRRGWVDVLYEGSGPAIRMEPGDVVLQPPGIRHRVLATSPGFEIIEVASPADHLTEFDHDTVLPGPIDAGRRWSGQPFVHWRRSDTVVATPWDHPGFGAVDCAIGAATAGRVTVRQVTASPGHASDTAGAAPGFRLLVVMDGSVSVSLRGEDHRLLGGDAITIPAAVPSRVHSPSDDCWLLDVTAP
jgi:quercetin dioxygenase-like cupin family protein